ncbi:MAG: hypothetical protein U9P50_03610 [Patescibacteria group bacterium]|nr:hypothetical protein [Patescibacteria group bacterium]
MSWSSKRKSTYITVTTSVILITVALITFSYLYEAPTCVDGKQNQEEDGIDCGGPCLTVCGFEIIDPIIHWSRVSKMYEKAYSVTALIENPNVSAEAYDVPYIFKIYDGEGLLVSEYTGETFIPANKEFPIFSGIINVGNRVPKKAIFEFTEKPRWLETVVGPEVFIDDIQFLEKNGLPRVSATISNNSVRNIENVELVVLLLDGENNLVNSSKTVLDLIRKDSSEKVIFTWPTPFDKEVIKVDIFTVSKLK